MPLNVNFLVGSNISSNPAIIESIASLGNCAYPFLMAVATPDTSAALRAFSNRTTTSPKRLCTATAAFSSANSSGVTFLFALLIFCGNLDIKLNVPPALLVCDNTIAAKSLLDTPY